MLIVSQEEVEGVGVGGLRKRKNGKGFEEPTRWKANRALRQTARRPKNLRIIMPNILVSVAVCTVQCLIFNFLPTFSKNLSYTRALRL